MKPYSATPRAPYVHVCHDYDGNIIIELVDFSSDGLDTPINVIQTKIPKCQNTRSRYILSFETVITLFFG